MQPIALTEYTMQSPLQQVAAMTVIVFMTIIMITSSTWVCDNQLEAQLYELDWSYKPSRPSFGP